jgi:hypothetical protein
MKTINFSNDIFEINPYCEISVAYIGQHQNLIVTVDNLLRDPMAARQFLEQIPQQSAVRTDGRRPAGYFPGNQTYINYDFMSLNQFIDQQLNIQFGCGLRRPAWSYQTCNSQTAVYTQSRYPHSDQGQIAANLFLNTPEEITGVSGTGFYTLRATGEESPFASNCQYRKQRYGYDNPNTVLAPLQPVKDDQTWQQYHLAEQKWNRLNIYEGALFHCVYFEENMFSQQPRMTLSMIDS